MGNASHSLRNDYFNSLHKSCKPRWKVQEAQRGSPWEVSFSHFWVQISLFLHSPQWLMILLEVPVNTCIHTLLDSLSYLVSSNEAVISLCHHLCAQGWTDLDTSSLSSVERAFRMSMNIVTPPSREVAVDDCMRIPPLSGSGLAQKGWEAIGKPASMSSLRLPLYVPLPGLFSASASWPAFPGIELVPASLSNWSSIHRLYVSLSPHFPKNLLCLKPREGMWLVQGHTAMVEIWTSSPMVVVQVTKCSAFSAPEILNPEHQGILTSGTPRHMGSFHWI